jgi:hypothetical protein
MADTSVTIAATPAQVLSSDSKSQAQVAAQVETTLSSVNAHDLIIFAGAGTLVLLIGIISVWVAPFQSVVANGVSTLIGAAAMYLKGK